MACRCRLAHIPRLAVQPAGPTRQEVPRQALRTVSGSHRLPAEGAQGHPPYQHDLDQAGKQKGEDVDINLSDLGPVTGLDVEKVRRSPREASTATSTKSRT